MHKQRILVTGAAGALATQVLPSLREHYDCTLTDVRVRAPIDQQIEVVQLADLLTGQLNALYPQFTGHDAVVHFAMDTATEDRFDGELNNVRMAYNVLRTASETGIKRAVIASSNHATDFYEPLLLDGHIDVLTPMHGLRPLSDNFYGWAKEAYEHLGFVFAAGKVGPIVENIHIRIGAPRPVSMRSGNNPGESYSFRRNLGAYISPRDLAQLVMKSIDAKDITNEWGVPWQVVYGISANTRAFWSIANARQVLGYVPKDDSEITWADDVRKFIADRGVTGKIGENP